MFRFDADGRSNNRGTNKRWRMQDEVSGTEEPGGTAADKGLQMGGRLSFAMLCAPPISQMLGRWVPMMFWDPPGPRRCEPAKEYFSVAFSPCTSLEDKHGRMQTRGS